MSSPPPHHHPQPPTPSPNSPAARPSAQATTTTRRTTTTDVNTSGASHVQRFSLDNLCLESGTLLVRRESPPHDVRSASTTTSSTIIHSSTTSTYPDPPTTHNATSEAKDLKRPTPKPKRDTYNWGCCGGEQYCFMWNYGAKVCWDCGHERCGVCEVPPYPKS